MPREQGCPPPRQPLGTGQRAALESRHLPRLVQILKDVTAVPCWSQGTERGETDRWLNGGGETTLFCQGCATGAPQEPELVRAAWPWIRLHSDCRWAQETHEAHSFPPAVWKPTVHPRATCPFCPLPKPSRASVPALPPISLLLPTLLTSRLPCPLGHSSQPKQMVPLHPPLIPGTHRWRSPHLSLCWKF